MTDFQIAVQIAATLVMAAVSVFLYVNARRMRLINEESIKIAVWEKRWKLYDALREWPIKVKKYLPSKEPATIFSGREAIEFIDLKAIEIVSVIKQSKLVFNIDQSIVSFLEKYHEMITPLISLEIGKEIKVEDVNSSLERFMAWIKQEFPNKVEDSFLTLLKLDY